MLFACISADVYEMIVDCADYETALSKLKRVYVKSPNAIFARHALATRKQNPEESLQTFLKELLVLSKACNFQDVTARDAICCSCKKRGHFSWACRSRLGSKYSG